MSYRNIAEDASDIGFAITHSINYTERVTIHVPSICTGLAWVNQYSESHNNTDDGKTEDGEHCEDVWGDDGQGGEFRLRLISEHQ